jgi:hypothetical protein
VTPAFHHLLQRQHGRLVWNREFANYLAFQMAAYVLLNVGEDVAMAAFMFC